MPLRRLLLAALLGAAACGDCGKSEAPPPPSSQRTPSRIPVGVPKLPTAPRTAGDAGR